MVYGIAETETPFLPKKKFTSKNLAHSPPQLNRTRPHQRDSAKAIDMRSRHPALSPGCRMGSIGQIHLDCLVEMGCLLGGESLRGNGEGNEGIHDKPLDKPRLLLANVENVGIGEDIRHRVGKDCEIHIS